jgi:hypothetical protein
MSFDAPIPECIFPDPIRGDYTDPGDDYPAHDVTPSPALNIMWAGHVALVAAHWHPAGLVRWVEKLLRKR